MAVAGKPSSSVAEALTVFDTLSPPAHLGRLLLRLILVMQNPADFLQPRLNLMFVATVVRMVVLAAFQFVGHVLLRSHRTRPVMRVSVPFVVAPAFHQGRRRIAQVQWHLPDQPRIHVGER